MDKNEDKTYQNLWDAAKAVLRGKFIAINAYIKKEERTQFNNLNSYFKKLGKEDQIKSKAFRGKEINKIEK